LGVDDEMVVAGVRLVDAGRRDAHAGEAELDLERAGDDVAVLRIDDVDARARGRRRLRRSRTDRVQRRRDEGRERQDDPAQLADATILLAGRGEPPAGHCAAAMPAPQPWTGAVIVLKQSRSRHCAATPRPAVPRKLRHDASARPAAVATQAASAIHTIASEIARSGGKSAASDRRRLASAYIPSGNTRLHSIGVELSGTPRMPCFQIPNSTSSGIHHVAHAHSTSVTLPMNGRIDCRNGRPVSDTISVAPALVAIAAAPITTHRIGVMSSGSTSRKKMRWA